MKATITKFFDHFASAVSAYLDKTNNVIFISDICGRIGVFTYDSSTKTITQKSEILPADINEIKIIYEMKLVDNYLFAGGSHGKLFIFKYDPTTYSLQRIYTIDLPPEETQNPKKVKIYAQPWGIDVRKDSDGKYHVVLTGAWAGVYHVVVEIDENDNVTYSLSNIYLSNYMNHIRLVSDPNNNYKFYVYATCEYYDSTFDPNSTQTGLAILAITQNNELTLISKKMGGNFSGAYFIEIIESRNLLIFGKPFKVFDISNRENPTLQGSLTENLSRPFVVDNNTIMSHYGTSIKKFDITDPTTPSAQTVTVSVHSAGWYGVAVETDVYLVPNAWTYEDREGLYIAQCDFAASTVTITQKFQSVRVPLAAITHNFEYRLFAFKKDKTFKVYDKNGNLLFSGTTTNDLNEAFISKSYICIEDGATLEVYDFSGNLLRTIASTWLYTRPHPKIIIDDEIYYLEKGDPAKLRKINLADGTVTDVSLVVGTDNYANNDTYPLYGIHYDGTSFYVLGYNATLSEVRIFKIDKATMSISASAVLSVNADSRTKIVSSVPEFSVYPDVSALFDETKVLVRDGTAGKLLIVNATDLSVYKTYNTGKTNINFDAVFFTERSEEFLVLVEYYTAANFSKLVNLTRNTEVSPYLHPINQYNYAGFELNVLDKNNLIFCKGHGESSIYIFKVQFPHCIKYIGFVDIHYPYRRFLIQDGRMFFYVDGMFIEIDTKEE